MTEEVREPKMSRHTRQRIRRLSEALDSLSRTANRINVDEVSELVRRSDIPFDVSYWRSSSFVNVNPSSGMGGTSVVEAAAIARVEGKVPKDILAEQVRTLELAIIDAEFAVRRITAIIDDINRPVEKKREPRKTQPCEVCHVVNISKSGLCQSCYQEWADAGTPDRQLWVMYKNQTTNSQGEILITEQPIARGDDSNP
jgi:hypothetical protein